MTKDQVEKAMLAGADTVRELGLWYNGFLAGQLSAIEQSLEAAKKIENVEPDYTALREEYADFEERGTRWK